MREMRQLFRFLRKGGAFFLLPGQDGETGIKTGGISVGTSQRKQKRVPATNPETLFPSF
jgi:hypothetical protein